nr:immunoglobulin heavy chain junction region [Mus musculus]
CARSDGYYRLAYW